MIHSVLQYKASGQMKTILQTTNLHLRNFNHSDLPNLIRLDSDPDVLRYISNGKIPSKKELEEVLKRIIEQYQKSDRYGLWACELRSTGEFIGWFHMRPYKEAPEEIELGYRLIQSVWGRGLATEGSMKLVERAFYEWKVPKVVAVTMRENFTSRRVMEKLGMTLEKNFIESRFPGANQNAVKYSLSINDFLRQHPKE